MRPDSADLITKLAWHFDEPFADSSAIPTYVVSEFAARHVKVALSGDGGDEFFAGYPTLGNIEKFQSLDRVPRALRQVASWAASALPYSAYGKNRLRVLGAASALDRYFEGNYTSYFLRQRMLQPDWMLPAGSGYLREILPDCFPPNGGDAMAQAQYFEAAANLTGDMLVKVDRASMAASLEVRCPMLDHQFAELAAGDSAELETAQRQGQGHPAGCAGRPASAGAVDAAQDGFRRAAGPMVPRSAARTHLGYAHGKEISGARHSGTGFRTLPAGRTCQRPPRQSSSDLWIAHAGIVAPQPGRTGARAGSALAPCVALRK